jgi:hypothetical protein
MGSLADLIIASANDVQAIAASDYPLGAFKGINIDGLDPLLLSELHSVLTGQESGTLLHKYQPIAEASPTGPWLIRFPEDMIASLANIPPQYFAATARKWAAVDRPGHESLSSDEAEKFIARLNHFARTAAFEGLEMFLWIYN